MIRTHRPRRATLAVTIAAGALLLTGCVDANRSTNLGQDQPGDGTQTGSQCPVGDPDDSITTTARIGFQHIPNGDMLVKQERLLEKCMPKAKISWTQFDSGGSAVQGFGADSVDLSLVGSSPTVKAMSAPLNIDVQVIYILDVIGEAESLVVKDKSITDVQGLKGKKVAVPFSSTAHFSLLKVLQQADLVGKVDLINLSPDKMLAAFDRGEIDGAWVWAPTLPELLDGGGTAILSNADAAEMGFPTFDLAVGTRKFIEANPEFMTMWTKVQDYASKQITDDPAAAAEPVAAELGLDPAAVEEQFAGYGYPDAAEQADAKYFGGGMATVLDETAKFLAEENEIKEVADPKHYEDGVYTEAIMSLGK